MDYKTKVRFKKSDIKPFERTVILGRTGAGKSILFDTLLTYLSKHALIVLIDAKREYKHIPPITDKILKEDKNGLYRCYELKYKGKVIDDPVKLAEFFAGVLFHKPRSILALEEMNLTTLKNYDLKKEMPKLSRLITQGRSMGVGFVGTSQRPQMISTQILSQAQHLLIMELNTQHDIKAVKPYVDPEKVEGLRRTPHCFLHINFQKDLIKRCYKLYPKDMYHSIRYYESIFSPKGYRELNQKNQKGEQEENEKFEKEKEK